MGVLVNVVPEAGWIVQKQCAGIQGNEKKMTVKGYDGTAYKDDDVSAKSDDYSVETLSTSSSDSTDKDPPKSSLCCLQGCLATSAVGFSFFVALPTGILMIIYAKNNANETLVIVGAVLACLPVITFLLLVFVCLNRSKLNKLRHKRNKITNKTVNTNNEQSDDSSLQKY